MQPRHERIVVPDPSLVLLFGASGSGKTTFAARHFAPTEVLASDTFRAMVADDERDMSATADAFELLHAAAAKRLAAGRLTVVDATNVQPEARRPLIALARRYGRVPVAIVFDLPERLCLERNAARGGRRVPPRVVRGQHGLLRRSLGQLAGEGFGRVVVLHAPEEVETVTIARERADGAETNTTSISFEDLV
jgi:protein phosphatase